MTRAARRARAGAVLTVALLLAGCTGGADPLPDPAEQGTTGATEYRDDPADIARLRDAAGLATCPSVPPAGPGAPADRLPDLTLDCLGDGPPVNLSDLGGVPYVVNVWAGWCSPCRDEMPYLQEVHDEAAGRIGVLGVDFQDTTVAGLSAAADFGVTFPSVQDLEGEVRAALRFPGPPVTAFVAADGRLVATKIGPFTSTEQLRDLIEQHLGVVL